MNPNKPERLDALLVIRFLGWFSILGLLMSGALLLAKVDVSGINGITHLLAAAVGGLSGLLASTKPNPDPATPQTVTVQQPANDPIPVDPTPTPGSVAPADPT